MDSNECSQHGYADGKYAYQRGHVPDPFAACWQRYPNGATIANIRAYCLAYVGGYIDAHCEEHPDATPQGATVG